MNYIQAEYEAERIISEAYNRNQSIVECDYRPDNYNDILRDFTDASGEFHRDLKEEMIKALLHDDEQEMQDAEVLIDMAFEKSLMEEKEREQEENGYDNNGKLNHRISEGTRRDA